MTDNEKRAHDLAILYMQLEIKEGQITIPFDEDLSLFVSEYDRLRAKITELLEKF